MVVAQKRRQGVGVDRSRGRQGEPGELSISECRFSNHRSSDRRATVRNWRYRENYGFREEEEEEETGWKEEDQVGGEG